MSLLEKVKILFGFSSSEKSATSEPGASISPSNQPVATPIQPKTTSGPPAAQRREQIIHFVLSKLRAYQNEPDTAPLGLRLGILCASPEEEEIYRVALWANKPGRFQEELTRQLADNYITLPQNWPLEYRFFKDELPVHSFQQGNLGLTILDKAKPEITPILARIKTLLGQTEHEEYRLDSTQATTYFIGRGHTTQAASGRVRTNHIVILNEDDPGFDPVKGAENGRVSRAHATIRCDVAQKRYVLVADPGGLPTSGNKTKIIHPDDSVERADIPGVGYPLIDGDQIELGGGVVLLFEVLGG